MASCTTYGLLLLAHLVFLSKGSQEMTDGIENNENFAGDSYGPTPEEMLMDVTAGTTPAVCPPKIKCGFLELDTADTGFHNHQFIPYCQCPEGQYCKEVGKNLAETYLYYKCHDLEHTSTSSESSAESTTDEVYTVGLDNTSKQSDSTTAESYTGSFDSTSTEYDSKTTEAFTGASDSTSGKDDSIAPERRYGLGVHSEL